MGNALLAVAGSQEPAIWFVCLLGVGSVFVGLVCIIGIVTVMNRIAALADKKKSAAVQGTVPAAAPVAAPAANTPIENRQEIIAAVCAAVAEENGTDISAIRVVSFKKL